ncbi:MULTISPECIES: CinA family nicotinamide mononucleotide deamidase-related protein [Psychrilyobacter]|uniref:CinA-like protein n=1 Tax=Psychrilyobacter piezotolerans TaxID=2293438 RepID=A0ABX9KCW0_9FUSO|nr:MULTISPECIES: CinA family nicotinamide mononucleotide deamidase-related protein [Psychrilyobacter]MCS5422883.1 CinA family nicotinamide mononucleotide deamidase-related protein [Psychrilyobacter sp. S5]NDI79254.1 CinA family nicotinamide mononucleotide deamidase-related protein [Psychrilyobacter piezotolerans]RDE58816.1 nicotinamide-nucleotide amidohydrolase family protein [Psychrilyobacter sp. S5]REI39305.1 nicotinamide-nucleotide amidohydrolase family protein [Psychrilyobacter piezotoleran
MDATIILVGTELLNGMTVDTNSIYMAEELNKYGIEIRHKLVVGDNIGDIVEAIEYGNSKSDLVILSGGLGPTMDDLTKSAISEFLKVELVVDRDDYMDLKKKYDSHNLVLEDKNLREAEKPYGSQTIINDVGMCKGIYIDKIAAFPGVPRELYNLFPKFLKLLISQGKLEKNIYIKDILVWGIPESVLETKVIHLFDLKGIHYEFLVKDYGIIIRLQTISTNKLSVDKITSGLYKIIGENVIGEDEERLETTIYKYLKEKKYDISLAESCTGGLIASKFIEVDGISSVFKEGIVCYSNESKQDRLGVKKETLDAHGAVSYETCEEMLDGLDTDVKIAVTGIAGPNGGTEEKPVGTVYIGVAAGDKKYIKKYLFNGNREKIRRITMMRAMFEVLKILKG